MDDIRRSRPIQQEQQHYVGIRLREEQMGEKRAEKVKTIINNEAK